MFRKRIGILLIFLIGCQPKGPHRDVNEGLGGTHGAVSYDQVRSVFAQNCAACHPSRSSPDWLDYTQAQKYATNGLLLRRAVTEKSMPPPGSPQAAAISENDRRMIAAWVQAGAPEHVAAPRAPTQEPVVSSIVQQCFQCHGARGPGAEAQAKIPRLNGQNKDYLQEQLLAFKWRRRIDPTNAMNDVATALNPTQIFEAANYFAEQPGLALGPAPASADLVAFQSGRDLALRYCISCHMSPKTSDVSVPVLAGQSEEYLRNQLLYFRSRERRNPLMEEYSRSLSDADIASLALFFALSR